MKKLNSAHIDQKLQKLNNWKLMDNSIKKNFEFANFKEALAFINKVGEFAESHDHHPELWNVYNKVSVTYTTHDVDGLTEKDFLLAELIDGIR